MDHIVCLNEVSFSVDDSNLASQLFSDSIQGVLELNRGNDRFILYFDSNGLRLHDFELATGFTYHDYLQILEQTGEIDLLLFLTEFVDKSPALNFISEEELDEACSYNFYMPGCAACDSESDLFGLAWATSATLLSIKSDDRWGDRKLQIARTDAGEFIEEELWIENIACSEHGIQIEAERCNEDVAKICSGHVVSDEFLRWYESLSKENKSRTVSKLKLSCARSFDGGKPLFDNLNNASGMREIRFSAYPGGAIRILFKAKDDAIQHILVGFIKKGDDEGYDVNIPRANEIYKL